MSAVQLLLPTIDSDFREPSSTDSAGTHTSESTHTHGLRKKERRTHRAIKHDGRGRQLRRPLCLALASIDMQRHRAWSMTVRRRRLACDATANGSKGNSDRGRRRHRVAATRGKAKAGKGSEGEEREREKQAVQRMRDQCVQRRQRQRQELVATAAWLIAIPGHELLVMIMRRTMMRRTACVCILFSFSSSLRSSHSQTVSVEGNREKGREADAIEKSLLRPALSLSLFATVLSAPRVLLSSSLPASMTMCLCARA